MAAVNVTFPGNLAQVKTAADLRSVPSTLLPLGALFLVNGLEGLFEYDPGSLAPDDGKDVLRPVDKTPGQVGRWIRNVDGLATGPEGPAGPANSTYTSLTALKAAPQSNRSYILADGTNSPVTYAYVAGDFTGRADDVNVVKLDAVPLTTGALVRQAAKSLSYTTDTVEARLANELWLTDRIPKSVMDSIKAGGNVDVSQYVQGAIDDLAAIGGGTLYYPKIPNYPLRMNVTLAQQVSHVGQGRGNTSLSPFIDAPVFATPMGKSCNNFRIENLSIFGNAAFTNQDGIRLETSGTGNFVDTVRLSNLDIRNCGRWGVYARGTSTSGPFVQRLYIDECEIGSNWRNIALLGCVLETGIQHLSCCQALDRSEGSASFLIDFDSGSIPGRVSIGGGSIFSNPGRYAMVVGAVECLGISDSGFEFADVGLFGADFSLIRNITVTNVSFNFVDAERYGIWIKRCKVLSVRGCTFSAGQTLQAGIYLDGAADAIPNPDVLSNMKTGTGVQQLVKDDQGALVTREVTAIRAYRSFLAVQGTGDLTDIWDIDFGLSNLVRGDSRITLISAGGTITVKHGTGNLRLAGAADYALTGLKSISFYYAGGVWIEDGRS